MKRLKLYSVIAAVFFLLITHAHGHDSGKKNAKDIAKNIGKDTGKKTGKDRGAKYKPSEITKIVILGTGTPNPDPVRSGNSLAIVVKDTPYIIDFGPGLIRRAAAMSPRYGGKIKGLSVKNIKRAFLTHLHSDHTTGYPDLILTPWVMGRDEPLEVYGPEGIAKMTKHILAAYKEDINIRLYGIEPANNQGWRAIHTTLKKAKFIKIKM